MKQNNTNNNNNQLLQQQQLQQQQVQSQKQQEIQTNEHDIDIQSQYSNQLQQLEKILSDFKSINYQKVKNTLVQQLEQVLLAKDQVQIFQLKKDINETLIQYKIMSQQERCFYKSLCKKATKIMDKTHDDNLLAQTVLKKSKLYEKSIIKNNLKTQEQLQLLEQKGIQMEQNESQNVKKLYNKILSTQKSPVKHKNSVLSQLQNNNQINSNKYQNQELPQVCEEEPSIQKKIKLDENQNQKFLKIPLKCHICSEYFNKVHEFYDQLCPPCAELNYKKRFMKCDLSGKYALVTGARVKIGYQIALILLRNNCEKVVVTSRFPKDTLLRYSQEPDFENFKNKLVIYGLDFRDLNHVYQFCKYLENQLPQLDILINNAAQTLRRDPLYYNHLLEQENIDTVQLGNNLKLSFQEMENVLPTNFQFENQQKQNAINSFYKEIQQQQQKSIKVFPNSQNLNESFNNENKNNDQLIQQQYNKQQQLYINTQNLSYSAMISQIPVLKSDFTDIQEKLQVLPQQNYDINNQQVDLSKSNSWVKNIDQIEFKEFVETQIINSWAPYLLIQNLKNLMCKNNVDYKQQRVIQNVSSMEGKFTKKYKSTSHPHTNMSKASLNMLTRTCGQYYSQFNIFMNSADTGWVSEMNPNSQNIKKTVPLDEVDGAMRVLDSIFTGFNSGQFEHSQFYKNYTKTQW